MNLRELANVTPTHFFTHVNLFFDNIFLAINDPKIRDSAVSALRSALYVISERERVSQDLKDNKSRIDQQIPNCFELCLEEVLTAFEDRDKSAQKEKDDKIQAALLILNELLRCSNDSGIYVNVLNRILKFAFVFSRYNLQRIGIQIQSDNREPKRWSE